VLLDGGEAGRTAAPLVAGRLAAHWWVRITELPDGQEPDTADAGQLEMLLGHKDQHGG
jgi:hypothetical protein